MTSLEGQVALVTGASGGIGGAIASSLAGQHAVVCATGRDARKIDTLARNAPADDGRIIPLQVDLLADEEVDRLVATLGDMFGRLDVLVHSAGEYSKGKLEVAPVDELDSQYRTNVRARYLLTQRLLPMLRRSSGQIVFINSSAGVVARAELSQYAATQHAARAIADSLREEVNADGIRVMNVFLGRTATPLQARIYEQEGRAYQPALLLQPDDVAAMVLSALTLPRTAEVTEISIRPLIKSY